MDLEYLAKKIISLEKKLYSPNERSFIIEGCDLAKAAAALEKNGYVDGYSPSKLFFQAYLPCYCGVDEVLTVLWQAGIARAVVKELSSTRARCFNKSAARIAFVDLHSRIDGADSDDFAKAKALAEKIECGEGACSACSVRFSF